MVRKTLGPSNFVLKASHGIQEMEHMDVVYDILGKKNVKNIILCGHVGTATRK
jgi:predicted metal-dependent hydrolase